MVETFDSQAPTCQELALDKSQLLDAGPVGIYTALLLQLKNLGSANSRELIIAWSLLSSQVEREVRSYDINMPDNPLQSLKQVNSCLKKPVVCVCMSKQFIYDISMYVRMYMCIFIYVNQYGVWQCCLYSLSDPALWDRYAFCQLDCYSPQAGQPNPLKNPKAADKILHRLGRFKTTGALLLGKPWKIENWDWSPL